MLVLGRAGPSKTSGRPSSRAAIAPARISPNCSSGMSPASTSIRTRAMVEIDRPRHGRRAQHRRRRQSLRAVRPRHLQFVDDLVSPEGRRTSPTKRSVACSRLSERRRCRV